MSAVAAAVNPDLAPRAAARRHRSPTRGQRLACYVAAVSVAAWCLGLSIPVISIGFAPFGMLLVVAASPLLLSQRPLHLRRAGVLVSFVLLHVVVINPFSGLELKLGLMAQMVVDFVFLVVMVNLAEDIDQYSRTVAVLLAATAAIAALLIYLHWFVFNSGFLSSHLSFEVYNVAGRLGRNTLSFLLVVAFPFAYARFTQHRSVYSAVIMAIVGFAALYTISRMALVCLIATLFLFVFLGSNRVRYRRQALAMVLVVVVLPFYFGIDPWKTFLLIRNPAETEAVEAGTKSLLDFESDRGALIWQSLAGLATSPIIGHGIGAFRVDTDSETHNDYLGLLYDFGLVGVGLFLAIFWVSFRDLRAARRGIAAEHCWLLDGQLISLVITALALLMINAYDSLPVWFVFAGAQIIPRAVRLGAPAQPRLSTGPVPA